MDDQIGQWLTYLQSRQRAAESNLRARSTITVPSAVALLIGSYIFINGGGALILGLMGLLVAIAVLIGSVAYNLKCILFISGSDAIIRRILLGQLSESTAINDQLNKLIGRTEARSSSKEGLEVIQKQ